jgi:hypothetical protein
MFYYLPVTLLCITLLVLSYIMPTDFLLVKLPRLTANIGIGVLRLTMLVKPVFIIMTRYLTRKRNRIVKVLFNIFYAISKRGMKYRRHLGITSFLIIAVHAGLRIIQWMQIDFTLRTQLQKFRLLAGYLGLLMLFIGYITSNNYSIRLFKKNRKLIQYSAYLALLFTLLHLAFIDFRAYLHHYSIFVVYLVLKIIEKKK